MRLANVNIYVCTAVLLICSSQLRADDQLAEWSILFSRTVSQHPVVIAASELRNSSISMSKSQERPLYNPEIGAEFEREGQGENFRVGLSQTVDVWDKRTSFQQQAGYSRSLAQAQYDNALQLKQAESLRALVQWQSATQLAELARGEEAKLQSLVALVKKRQQTGDMSQLDADLTLLSLMQKLNYLAQAETAVTTIESQLNDLLPNWAHAVGHIPESFWRVAGDKDDVQSLGSEWLELFPEVAAAKAQWKLLQQSAELARKSAKAEPTFGLNAGQTGGEGVIGLTFSMPLNVRNNYSANVRAANQEALAAEAQYRALRNKHLAAISASHSALTVYQTHFNRWRELTNVRGRSSDRLLAKLLESGDISTSDYLLALQQRSEGLAAGIELESQFRFAYIEWLVQSGKLTPLITQLSIHHQ